MNEPELRMRVMSALATGTKPLADVQRLVSFFSHAVGEAAPQIERIIAIVRALEDAGHAQRITWRDRYEHDESMHAADVPWHGGKAREDSRDWFVLTPQGATRLNELRRDYMIDKLRTPRRDD